ncbi:MAG: serine/threonine protein kinase [Phycisphaerales bacterium]|nr:serine/threonine protein kinase [Phycisphaerales bacterium]
MTTPVRAAGAGGGFSTTPVSGAAPGSGLSGTGFLHAGELLAGRYRIVSRLGGGGMGEVYRADDLTLGASVALKLLPPEAITRPGWLDRFRNEVRLTRQISHPNVCRVYDIAEIEGRVFLSMEFIDGEDLSSLLRRIGRLPQDKAVELARQVCFGLAAAHELGVVHRDLKPANIMVDGRGNARVMDFGVAGFAAELNRTGDVAAGTPAYMAPEQLEGREVSKRSDIFSLGLILYEIFTGKPAFKAQTLADLRAIHSGSTRPTNPTELVAGLDPAVERVILHCLEHEPGRRPSSAVGVAAALPGGDPLAAALAAGETPSPELVAASGEAGTIRPALAIALTAAVLVLLVVTVGLRDRLSLLWYARLENSAEVLAAKAREALRTLGYDQHPRSAYGFTFRVGLLNAIAREDQSARRWDKLLDPALTPVSFWYRVSPQPLLPTAWWRVGTTLEDPPVWRVGDTVLTMDVRGNLRGMTRIEPIRERDMAAVPDGNTHAGAETTVPPGSEPLPKSAPGVRPAPTRPVDELLAATMGLEKSSLTAVEPGRLFLGPTDGRAAFSTSIPGKDPVPITVEVGTTRGRISSIETVYPWSYSHQDAEQQSLAAGISDIGGGLLQVTLLVSSAFLARRNLLRNRADRRGAWRLACFSLALSYTISLLMSGVGSNPLGAIFGLTLVRAIHMAVLWWVFYIALEPATRRLWPQAIVSWSRLLDGRWRDPLVGRDVLVGVLAGLVLLLLQEPAINLAAHITGQPPPVPAGPNNTALTSARFAVGQSLEALRVAMLGTLLASLGLVILRAVLRRALWTGIGFFGVFYVMAQVGPFVDEPGGLVLGLLWAGVLTFVFMRLGVLSSAATVSTALILMRIPATMDFSRWYAVSGVPVVLGIIVIALVCARSAIGRQAIFAKPLLDA